MPIVKVGPKDKPEMTIYVEVDRLPESRDPYGEGRDAAEVARRAIQQARDIFGEGLELANTCAKRVVQSIRNLSPEARPEEFAVEMAIKLDSEVGAVVAKAGAEAQLKVSMKWVRDIPPVVDEQAPGDKKAGDPQNPSGERKA